MRARTILAPLLLLALAGCKTELNANLSEGAANEEVALLLHHGIPASRGAEAKAGLYSVLVEGGRFADAVDLLHAHGLPRTHYDTIPDVFKGGGLVPSPTEERARLMYALGEELSRTISEIDGVLGARVHIVTPDNDPLRRDLPPSSASVFVRYKAGSRVDTLVPQIKMLVADAVSGLGYDKVSVIAVPASVAADDAGTGPDMVDVWGIEVDAGSAGIVRTVGAVLGGLLAALLGAGAWFGWQNRATLLARRRLPGRNLITR